jgi:YfiH family protein
MAAASGQTETSPKSSHAFLWVQGPLGRTLVATALAGADAWFTTRDLPLSGTERAQEWSRVASRAGVPRDRLVGLAQIHGAAVHVHRRGVAPGSGRPQADAAVTDDPAVALTVQVADCVPVLLADAEGGGVAAVHAGWRGTAAGAARAVVDALRAELGVGPERLIAAMGPSIGPCCYQVGADVEWSFSDHGHPGLAIDSWFTRARGSLTLDLWTANRDQLVERGVSPDRIHIARLCTACHPDLFHSYRRDGAGTGRMLGVIRLVEGSSSSHEP